MLHESFINLYGKYKKKEKKVELFSFFLNFEYKKSIHLKSWIRIQLILIHNSASNIGLPIGLGLTEIYLTIQLIQDPES